MVKRSFEICVRIGRGNFSVVKYLGGRRALDFLLYVFFLDGDKSYDSKYEILVAVTQWTLSKLMAKAGEFKYKRKTQKSSLRKYGDKKAFILFVVYLLEGG
jgi:hypothetical protein